MSGLIVLTFDITEVYSRICRNSVTIHTDRHIRRKVC